ncbi:transcription initiation protein [Glycomyces paridis]|uniref:Transcription initiation protein n=2 Tax=Glycomyces paridis TaxID=2126555 RepID=A0A4S8P2B5_9ACTN|nr:transcription initiation protein [Glycomyces paridis]
MLVCVPVEETGDDADFGPYLAAARGHVTGTTRLRPASEATTVRAEGGEVLLSDGPYAETREVIAGVDLVEAPDLDAAIALASLHPAVLGGGAIEIRPVWK